MDEIKKTVKIESGKVVVRRTFKTSSKEVLNITDIKANVLEAQKNLAFWSEILASAESLSEGSEVVLIDVGGVNG